MSADIFFMSLLDFEGEYNKRKALLALFGLFIVLPTAFLGSWLFAAIVNPDMGLVGGLSAVTFVGGIMGFLVVLARQTVQDINIRVVQVKE